MQKFNIAYVIESLGSGGAERQFVELIRRLDNERFNVRVLTFVSGSFFLPELLSLGVSVRRIRRAGRWDLRPVLQLAIWLRTGRVDLVHAYLNTANVYTVLARMIARRGKAVVSERSVEQHYDVWRHRLRRWTYRYADATITNSNTARIELIGGLKLNPQRVMFIPNGIDTDKFSSAAPEVRSQLRKRLGWHPNERIALTVASYRSPKNHLGILNAINGLSRNKCGTPLRFCWTGHTEQRDVFEQVERRIAELSLNDVVQVMGPRRDIIDLYRACDILVLNSLWEGTPNVVLEALACCCPVVATDVSDVGRYVIPGETGWLVRPGDDAGLCDVLRHVSLMRQEDLIRMGEKGRQHLLTLQMDPVSMAHDHERIYADLLGSRHTQLSEAT